MKVDDILVYWIVPTFNRQSKGSLPLPTYRYELEWTKTSENERTQIINILGIL